MMPIAVVPAMPVMAPMLPDGYSTRPVGIGSQTIKKALNWVDALRLRLGSPYWVSRGVSLDANVIFWTGAFANMLVIVALMAVAVRSIRVGNVKRHKGAMITAMVLILGFLTAYPLKVAMMGREDLSVWSTASVRTLYFHESCVVVMLIAGIFALTRAWRLRKTRAVTRRAEDPPAPETTLRWHRRAGWVGVVGAVLGLLSAGFVLAGMYARL